MEGSIRAYFASLAAPRQPHLAAPGLRRHRGGVGFRSGLPGALPLGMVGRAVSHHWSAAGLEPLSKNALRRCAVVADDFLVFFAALHPALDGLFRPLSANTEGLRFGRGRHLDRHLYLRQIGIFAHDAEDRKSVV